MITARTTRCVLIGTCRLPPNREAFASTPAMATCGQKDTGVVGKKTDDRIDTRP
ncbi:MAG: hypothetical protein ACLU9V_06755 [Roseburia sp.]